MKKNLTFFKENYIYITLILYTVFICILVLNIEENFYPVVLFMKYINKTIIFFCCIIELIGILIDISIIKIKRHHDFIYIKIITKYINSKLLKFLFEIIRIFCLNLIYLLLITKYGLFCTIYTCLTICIIFFNYVSFYLFFLNFEYKIVGIIFLRISLACLFTLGFLVFYSIFYYYNLKISMYILAFNILYLVTICVSLYINSTKLLDYISKTYKNNNNLPEKIFFKDLYSVLIISLIISLYI